MTEVHARALFVAVASRSLRAKPHAFAARLSLCFFLRPVIACIAEPAENDVKRGGDGHVEEVDEVLVVLAPPFVDARLVHHAPLRREHSVLRGRDEVSESGSV